MTIDSQETQVCRYIECYNNFDINGMLACIIDSVIFENSSGGEITARANGKTEFKTLAKQSAELFTSRKQTITKIEYHQDTLLVCIDYQGVLAKDLPNGLRAGETIRLSGHSEFRFVDGKISFIKDIS